MQHSIEKIRPDRGRIEKWVLHKAFDDDQKPYLPNHIMYRQKEQFSDGVGYSWIDCLKDHANKQRCSTAKAVEWDAEWSKNSVPSGRAALGIHAAAYEESKDVKTRSLVRDSPQKLIKGVAEKVAAVV
ncbi:putative asparagine synthase (glutamine-hydrolyzing) [Rosa chinensis]|uniref:Putative asparagine synthase (Glutamine-hydrolyzing) n=1 Tax=Rosa chinensis TaxID=74649 RepID=A0A2P6RQK3_ROSCH|nr:putative asparagine synthase (glutamine-hydrolyzing) [Rosa chinensis]